MTKLSHSASQTDYPEAVIGSVDPQHAVSSIGITTTAMAKSVMPLLKPKAASATPAQNYCAWLATHRFKGPVQ